jgi:hypothetical protein
MMFEGSNERERDVRKARFVLGPLLLLAVLFPTTSATAQTYVGVTPPVVSSASAGDPADPADDAEVLGVRLTSPNLSAQVAGTQVSASRLAFTGMDLLSLVSFGVAFIAFGAVLARRSRGGATPKA